MADTTFITKESLEKMKLELKNFKEVRRKEVAERIRLAKEQGDLSENAEYVEAKEEQAFLEGKIAELDNKVKTAVVIDDSHKNSRSVTVGSTIRIKQGAGVLSYTIVGSDDADPSQGKISNVSPIGRAMLGKKVGDIVDVTTPGGMSRYEIVEFE